MRAAVYNSRSPEGITIVSKPKPQNRSKHVLCRVKAAGLNPVDAKAEIGDKLPTFLDSFSRSIVEGRIAGFDFAGVVEEFSGFCLGDRVFGTVPAFCGTFCEYVSAPIDQIIKIPECLAFEEAATLGISGLTCIQVFKQHNLKSGQKILVIGASGGVGHMAVGIGMRMGLQVIGLCSSRNVEFVKSLGASNVLEYDSSDFLSELKKILQSEVLELVLDTVTSSDVRDSVCQYERLICNSNPPVLSNSHKHNFVTIGGPTSIVTKLCLMLG